MKINMTFKKWTLMINTKEDRERSQDQEQNSKTKIESTRYNEEENYLHRNLCL